MEQLERAGYKTYVVGGAVRNRLLGIPQRDIDLVTLGSPEDVCSVAGKNKWKVHKVGAEFGIVVVVIEGRAFEVASARRDCYGKDSHRPEKVSFVQDIREDLARRDFTINAMALDRSGRIIDPFGGQADLRAKTIRAVGDPLLRFAEDGLRSFRGVRLAAELGFEIEPSTLKAISQSLYRVKGLSVERVYAEIEKILLAPYAGYGLELLAEIGLAGCICTSNIGGRLKETSILGEILSLRGRQQNTRNNSLDAWNHTLKVVDGVPPQRELRWGALFHHVEKGTEGVRGYSKKRETADLCYGQASAEIALKVLSRLRAPSRMADRVSWLVLNHMCLPDADYKSVVKWVGKRAEDFRGRQDLEEAVVQLLILCRAHMKAEKVDPDFSMLDKLEKIFSEVMKKVPFYYGDLAIGGREVADRLGAGPQVQDFLDILLRKVQKGEMDNELSELRKALDKRFLPNRKG